MNKWEAQRIVHRLEAMVRGTRDFNPTAIAAGADINAALDTPGVRVSPALHEAITELHVPEGEHE